MKYNLFLIIIAFLWIGCSDDDSSIVPEYRDDTNWFILQDSQDELDHLRYEIYKTTNVPIYYNDTIGKQFNGIDAYGDSIIHYEILAPYYTIMASKPASMFYTLSKDRNDIRNAILFLRDRVLPQVAPEAYPKSFLLVEDFLLDLDLSTPGQRRPAVNAYLGYMTTIIANISRLETMSTAKLDSVANETISVLWFPYLDREGLLNEFYAVTENCTNSYPIYGASINPYSISDYRQAWTAYGFLTYEPTQGGTSLTYWNGGNVPVYKAPSKETDVAFFIRTVLNMNEEKFQATYGQVTGYDLLLRKYQLIKKILE